MEDVKNRIAEALRLRGMKQVELSERTGISPASINSWVKNRWQPKQTPLHKIAKVLDVSEMWLAGYDVPMDRPAEQKKAEELSALVKLLKDDPQLNNIFKMLSTLDKSQLDMIEQLLLNITNK